MKKLFTVLSVSLLLVSGTVFASFPVQEENKTENQITVSDAQIDNNVAIELSKSEIKTTIKKDYIKSTPKKGGKSKTTLILLWVFLGGFAAHRWYAGKPAGWNILFILTAGGCGVWAIIDLIKIITDEF